MVNLGILLRSNREALDGLVGVLVGDTPRKSVIDESTLSSTDRVYEENL